MNERPPNQDELQDLEQLVHEGIELEHQMPILPSTVFNIGSMAKQFTAFAMALLEDEGKLSFDDSIRKYLPEMHDFGKTITVRHLIHHTSGLRGSFPDSSPGHSFPPLLAKWLEF